MIPGRSLADPETLRIIARISRAGTAAAAPGDPYGEALVDLDERKIDFEPASPVRGHGGSRAGRGARRTRRRER